MKAKVKQAIKQLMADSETFKRLSVECLAVKCSLDFILKPSEWDDFLKTIVKIKQPC